MREIHDWLTSIGLARCAEAFETNEIGLDLLRQVDDQTLKDIGVLTAGGRLPSPEFQCGVERLGGRDHDSARLHAYAVHVTESLLRLREICRPDAQSRQIIFPSGRIGCSLTEELLNSILQDDLNPAVLHDERDCTRSLNIF
jgi:hypothetical protein